MRQSGGRKGGSTSTNEEREKSGERNNRRREEVGEGGTQGVSEDRESSDLCVSVYISQDPQQGGEGGGVKRDSGCVEGSRSRRAMKTNRHGGPQRSVHLLQMVHGHDETMH